MRFAVYSCFLFCLAATLSAQEPNDSFATALPADDLVVTDSLFGGGPHPDTLLASFDSDDFLRINALDDDSSPWGDGFASSLDGPVQPNGSINLGVTGTGDESFIGDHTEDGSFYLQVDIYDSGDALIDQLAADQQLLEPNDSLFYAAGDQAWIGGRFVATIDNQLDMTGTDQYDYWRFSGLSPGIAFSAEVTQGEIDSIIGWFNDAGTLAVVDDDGGEGKLSKLSGLVPENGEVVVGVTGFNILGDAPFSDRHPQNGNYTLVVAEIDADFDNDGNFDCTDIDALVLSLHEDQDVAFDLNGDGAVDPQDIRAWLSAASTHDGPLLDGDANLDGFVDVRDFNIWNDHRNSGAVKGWCQGNFNADVHVDELDFDIWFTNRFTASDRQGLAASVPEPEGAIWMLVAVLTVVCRFRESRSGCHQSITEACRR